MAAHQAASPCKQTHVTSAAWSFLSLLQRFAVYLLLPLKNDIHRALGFVILELGPTVPFLLLSGAQLLNPHHHPQHLFSVHDDKTSLMLPVDQLAGAWHPWAWVTGRPPGNAHVPGRA